MPKLKYKYVIGIDEVGRGALAGPVTVAALLLPHNFSPCGRPPEGRQFPISNFQKKYKIKLKDSKKLSRKQREIWFKWIKNYSNILKNIRIVYAVASVSPKIIDKINISNAANLAATSALKALIKNYKLRIKNCLVYLDGGLFLNSKFCILNSTTVVKGDEKIPAISLASIVAKVSRDRMMRKLHKKYPQYDFINNVGYGTKKHISAIKKYGRLPIHRKSFMIK